MAILYAAKTGNDTTGTGTISNPWLTVNKLLTSYSAGDDLVLRAGTYDLSASIAGTTAYKSLMGYPGETVIIQPSGSNTYNIRCTGATAGFNVRNIEFLNMGSGTGSTTAAFSNSQTSIHGVFEDVTFRWTTGTTTINCLSLGTSPKGFLFKNVKVLNERATGYIGWGVSPDTAGFNKCYFYNMTQMVISPTGLNNVIFDSCIWENCVAAVYTSSTAMNTFGSLSFSYCNFMKMRISVIIYSNASNATVNPYFIKFNNNIVDAPALINNSGAGTMTVDAINSSNNAYIGSVDKTYMTTYGDINVANSAAAQFYNYAAGDYRLEITSPLVLSDADVCGCLALERGSVFYDSIPATNIKAGTGPYKVGSRTPNVTPSLDLPAEADVKVGVVFDGGTKTGTFDYTNLYSDPGEVNVLSTASYKYNSATPNRFGRWTDISDLDDVHPSAQWGVDGISITGTQPDPNFPIQDDVKDGIVYGNAYWGEYTGDYSLGDINTLANLPDPAQVQLGITYGENLEFEGTLVILSPNYPLESLVIEGTVYGDETVEKIGKYKIIYPEHVVEGIEYGWDDNSSTPYSGVYKVVAKEDVRAGVPFGYDTNLPDPYYIIGELDIDAEANLPAENQVQDQLTFGSSLQFQGTLSLPQEYHVKEGEAFGPDSSYTGTLVVPDPDVVLIGYITGGQEGTVTLPNTDQVLDGTTYGPNLSLTGSASGANLDNFTDLPENLVKDQTPYKYNSSTYNRLGSLGRRVPVADGDPTKRLVASVKERMIDVLGGDYSELAYVIDISKNTFKNNYNRFGVLAQASYEEPGVIGYVTVEQNFRFILTNGFINKPLTDDLQREKTLILQDLCYQIYKDLVATKAGLPDTCITVRDLLISDPTFIEKDNVIVINADIKIKYRQRI